MSGGKTFAIFDVHSFRGLKKATLFSILIILAVTASAQKPERLLNLQTFDYKTVHFGFIIGFNTSDFYIKNKADFTFSDSLKSLQNVPQSGFNLALLASLDISPNLHLRFLPGLSFQDRGLDYTFLTNEGKSNLIQKRIESVFLDFPLNFKFRTNRVGNFAAYALIGAKYSIDMQTQKGVDNASESQKIIRLKDQNYSLDVGGGFDFFLPFFKFGVEIKTEMGFPNMLIQEDTRFSSPIESLRTRAVIVSLTFEG
jgi:hypothetical protein